MNEVSIAKCPECSGGKVRSGLQKKDAQWWGLFSDCSYCQGTGFLGDFGFLPWEKLKQVMGIRTWRFGSLWLAEYGTYQAFGPTQGEAIDNLVKKHGLIHY